MRLSFGEFLSRILVKARRQYRFAGLVLGKVGIGIIWPARGDGDNPKQPELPGIRS